MPRYSLKRQNHWEISFWLVFNADGSVRMTRGEPDMFGGERAMSMTARIPHSLFRVSPLQGTITLGEAQGPPPAIDIAAAEAALTEAFGARVELIIKEPTS